MTRSVGAFAALSWVLFASFCHAETSYSLGLDLSRYEARLSQLDQNNLYRPSTLTLNASVFWENERSLTVSIWKGEGDESFTPRLSIEHQAQGASLIWTEQISEQFSISSGFLFDEINNQYDWLRAGLPIDIEEDIAYQELSVSGNFDQELGETFSFSAGGTLSYYRQKREGVARTNIGLEVEFEPEKQKDWLFSPYMSLSHYALWSEFMLVSSIDVAWTFALNESFLSSRETNGSSGSPDEESSSSEDSSGSVGASIAMLWREYHGLLYLRRTQELSPNLASAGLEIGYSF